MRTGIILSGGKSSRLGQDKGLIKLANKPLIDWIINTLFDVVDEVIVVVGSKTNIPEYWQIVPHDVRVVPDCFDEGSPMIGLITGLRAANGEYAVVCACDMPFINPVILELLFCVSNGCNGTILVKPNGWFEPFPSIYKVSNCLNHAESLRDRGELRIRRVLETIPDTVQLSIDKLREIDPDLRSFIDLDSLESIEAAKQVLNAI